MGESDASGRWRTALFAAEGAPPSRSNSEVHSWAAKLRRRGTSGMAFTGFITD